jgi:hypothetical protein
MVYLTLILAVIALIVAILAYQKAGGMADLRKQLDHIASSPDLKKSIESLAATTESLKEKTSEAIGRMETAFKKEVKVEEKPARKPATKRRTPRKRAATTKKKPSAESSEEPSST